MKRKIRLRGTASLLFAALLLTVSLTACGGKTEPSSSETGSTASTQGTVSEASEVSEAPVSSGASDVSGTVSTGNAASKPPSNNDNNPNSSRGVASNAGTQWDPKNEIDLPDEIELQIKPVKDAVLHETPKDMGGKKFIFATFYPQYYTAGAEANATMRLDAIASIEKDYHCDIEIITLNPNTYANLINTAKASGQLYANIYELQTGFCDVLARSGILADLRTVSSMNLAGNEWNPAFTLGSYYNGGTYGVGVDRTKVNYECIFFNKNIAKKYGLGDFYELVMNKEWTYEKFFEISQEVYRKSNRQITGMFTFQQEKTGNFVFANDTSPAAMDGNRVIFNSKDPKLLRALDFLQQYSRMGGMDLDKYERFGEIDANQVFTDGKCLFYTAWSNLSVMLLARNMKDDFGMLPLPMGPDAKNYKGILWGPYFCSLANDDPAIEDSAKILVAFCNRTNVPIKQIDQQVAPYFRDDESLQMLHLMMTSDITVVPGANYDGPLKNYYQGVIPQVVLLQQTPQQALESVAKSVQTSLDSYYGN